MNDLDHRMRSCRPIGPRALARADHPAFGALRSLSLSRRLAHAGCVAMLAAATWGLGGCYVPIGPKPEPAGRQEHSPTLPRPMPGVAPPIGSAPVTRLTINGETIEAADLWQDVRASLLQRARMLSPSDYQRLVEQATTQRIRDTIAETLLFQEATLRQPSEIATRIDEMVEGEIRKTVATEYGGIQRRYETFLQAQGRSLDDVRTKWRREIAIAHYLEKEIKPRIVEPTRAKLLAAFDANRDLWRRPAGRAMSLIDVRVSRRLPEDATSPTPEQREAARAKARSIAQTARTELNSGVPFADVARAHSDGLHAAEGGAWGRVTREGVRERFLPAVEALERLHQGEVSDILETQDGFFLVRCDEIDAGFEPDFASVQPELKERHYRASHNRLIAELVTRLRAEARIEPVDLGRFHAAVVAAAPKPPGDTAP